jgi:hypothetical protein
MLPRGKELPVPDVLSITVESLGSEAQFLKTMALGRPAPEAAAILRAAAKVTRLGETLERMIRN